jgi:hypothetical protein
MRALAESAGEVGEQVLPLGVGKGQHRLRVDPPVGIPPGPWACRSSSPMPIVAMDPSSADPAGGMFIR